MSRIKDVSPAVDPNAPANGGALGGTSPNPPQPTACVAHGSMTNGIPNVDFEPFNTIDDAIQFAGTIVGSKDILYIEYMGLKLGVNL